MATFVYNNGRRVEMSDRYIQLLTKLGKGKAADSVSAKPAKVERKDMQAEAEISPTTGKPKRQYKRRDMKAEE